VTDGTKFSRISENEKNFQRYIQIFKNSKPELPFHLISFRNLQNFRLNGSLFGNSTFSEIPDFQEVFLGKL